MAIPSLAVQIFSADFQYEVSVVLERKVFHVSSSFLETTHEVNFRAGSCSCYNFRLQKLPCRHMFKVIESGLADWKDLPLAYREMPFFVIDTGKLRMKFIRLNVYLITNTYKVYFYSKFQSN